MPCNDWTRDARRARVGNDYPVVSIMSDADAATDKVMSKETSRAAMPANLAAIVEAGFAIWADDSVDETLRGRFDRERIPVAGVRQVRVWGLQVDDERELPGLERTQIPDEEVWEVNLVAEDGSRYEFDSTLLIAAPTN